MLGGVGPQPHLDRLGLLVALQQRLLQVEERELHLSGEVCTGVWSAVKTGFDRLKHCQSRPFLSCSTEILVLFILVV